MTAPVCLISGVGPGTGSALARRFAQGGYRVAMLARDEARLRQLEGEIPDSKAFRGDVTRRDQIETTVDGVLETLGEPEVFIHNAVGGAFGTFLEIDPA